MEYLSLGYLLRGIPSRAVHSRGIPSRAIHSRRIPFRGTLSKNSIVTLIESGQETARSPVALALEKEHTINAARLFKKADAV